MTKDDFLKGLMDNIYIEDYEEMSLYRYEYVKFYLQNEVLLNGERINLIKPKPDQYDLINEAFFSLRNKYGFNLLDK